MLAGAAGSWFAALGSLLAVGVALWCARRVAKVELLIETGTHWTRDSHRAHEWFEISVTNRGEKPVTVVGLAWRVGRGRRLRTCAAHVPKSSSSPLPRKLDYGESATFDWSLGDWKWQIEHHLPRDAVAGEPRSLPLSVHTSVGQTRTVVPGKGGGGAAGDVRRHARPPMRAGGAKGARDRDGSPQGRDPACRARCSARQPGPEGSPTRKVLSPMIRERTGMRTTVLDSDLYYSGDRGVAGVAVGIHMRIANRLCFLQNIKRKI